MEKHERRAFLTAVTFSLAVILTAVTFLKLTILIDTSSRWRGKVQETTDIWFHFDRCHF